MALKSDLVPDAPLPVRNGLLGNWSNLTVDLVRIEHDVSESVSVTLPGCMNVTALEEADAADPDNRLRIYSLKIGESAYRVTFSAAIGEADIRRLAMMAFCILGVEHGEDIRASIAAARAKYQTSGG